MPDSTNQGWQELQLPSRRECPKLFYSFSANKDSLTLLLTDLIAIWDCSLDKYDILAEAARQRASIDPSESSAQFEVLLSKLRQSLQDGQNVLVRDKSHASQALLLRTTVKLPKPLRALGWQFRLISQNASELAERLLRPSLHEVSVSQDKIESLLRIIKEKDHVISRLLDRIGNTSVDLGLIFPGITGASSRKGGQLSVTDAKKHVVGMAGFDEKSWVKKFSNEEGYEGADRTGLQNLVRGCEKCFVHTREQHEDWLSRLSTPAQLERVVDNGEAQSQHAPNPPATVPSDSGDESTESDNDFERQATPPGLKSTSPDANRAPAPARSKDDSTDSEEDEPAPKKAKSSKIRGLGRRHATKAYGDDSKHRPQSSSSGDQASSPPYRQSPDAPPTTRQDTATSTDTDTHSGESTTRRYPRKQNAKDAAQAIQPRQKPKVRLGTLRKKRESSSVTDRTANNGDEHPDTSLQAPALSSRPNARQGQDTQNPTLDRDADPRPSSPLPSPRSTGRLGRGGSISSPIKDNSANSTPEPDRDDDLDAPAPALAHQTRSSQRAPESQTTPSRRLGRLGGRKQQQEEEVVTGARARSAIIDDDVVMRDGDDSDATPPQSPSTSKQKRSSPQTTPIGSRKTERTSASRSSPVTEPRAEETKVEETLDQKANRRRAELKRSIAANEGVKKKRRF